MPLEHLLTARLTEVGKIKLGGLGEEKTGRSGEKYRMPVKYDHFVITGLHRDADGRLIADGEVSESLREHADPDGKIRRLPVTLLSNDIDEVMSARYVAYAGKIKIAESDGLVLCEYTDGPGGPRLPEPRRVPHTPEALARWRGMKLAVTLNVMIDAPGARWGGVYKLRSTSQITANQLYGSLKLLQRLTGGILRGLPLQLVVRPMAVAPDGQPTTVYVCHIELAGVQREKAREIALQQIRYELANIREAKALELQYRQLLAHEELDEDELQEFGLSGSASQEVSGTLTTETQSHREDKDQEGERSSPGAAHPAPPRDPPEVESADGARILAASKGRDSAWCLDWLNKAFRMNYIAGRTAWRDIPIEQRRKLIAALNLMDDAESVED